MSKVKIAKQPIGPFPLALAGADVNGKPNYAAVGACGVICQEPVLFVSLKNTHYTTRGVKSSGYFSLNIPAAGLVSKVDYCGVVSGEDTDKSSLFTSFYDETGKAPMIQECPLNFLCEVINTVPVFDFEMFIGKITAAYINEECLNSGKPDPLKIDPILIMGHSYLNLKSVIGTIYKEAGK